jgi:hypothetical protein
MVASQYPIVIYHSHVGGRSSNPAREVSCMVGELIWQPPEQLELNIPGSNGVLARYEQLCRLLRSAFKKLVKALEIASPTPTTLFAKIEFNLWSTITVSADHTADHLSSVSFN